MATKDEFLENAFIYNSMSASTQRNTVYATGDSQGVRHNVRRTFRKELSATIEPFLLRSHQAPPLIAPYDTRWPRAEAEFLSAVDQLYVAMGIALLARGSAGIFRIGHAQKSLALLLKYYWCDGKTKTEPVFCPIDRWILRKAGIQGNWTALNNMTTYEGWLTTLQAVATRAGYPSLAQWELAVY